MVDARSASVIPAELELPGRESKALSSDEATLLLRPGQILRASVLELLGPGEALLGLMGARVRVKTNVGLQPGTELSLEVLPDGARILLRPVDRSVQVAEGDPFRGILVEGPLARVLTRTLPQHPLEASGVVPLELRPESPVPDATELKTLHEVLGVGFERRILSLPKLSAKERQVEVDSLVRSLRSIGGRIPGHASAERSEPPPPPIQELADAVAGWRGEQVSRAEHGMPFVYPFSFAEPRWLADGRLFLIHEEPKHAEDSPQRRSFTLVFLLDLESLGPLRVDAAIRGSELSVEFTCTRESSALRIREHAGELTEALQGAGLRLVSTHVKIRKDGTVPVLDLLPPPAEGTSVLDLEI